MNNYEETIETETVNEGEIINMNKELKLIKPRSKNNSKGVRSSAGACTIINSAGCGKRLTFPKALLEKLGIEETVDVSISKNGLVIGSNIPESSETFTLRASGRKGVIYSYSLAEEIAEVFELDFSDKVSMTFTEVEFINDGEHVYAEIKMK